MRIELYSISWNERRMLPFFLNYYEPWIDSFVIFDDQSDDGTAETLAQNSKVDLRPFPPKGSSFVLAALEIWQHAWKESRARADWVIVSNIDEFIYHPDGMRNYLERCSAQGVTVIHPRGFEMVGQRFPDPGQSLVETMRKGVAMFGQDKRQVFNPDAVIEMQYGPGRHSCSPIGRIVEPSTVEASLLHYKHVDTAYLLRRQRSLAHRMLEGDRLSGYGVQYHLSPEKILRSYEWLQLHAYNVLRPD